MMKRWMIVLLSACFYTASHAQQFYDVTKFGAKKDSSAKATAAIKKAIDAASKAGGGTVYFPAGKYLTGPIHLKSNITIFIDAGAELHFSDDYDDYLPMVESRYEGVDVYSFSPLFYAYKAENITIRGRGKINGHGQKWWNYVLNFPKDQPRNKWQLAFDAANKNILLTDDSAQMKRGFLRPPFIQPMYCKNVLIEGITITNSPFWTINPEFCENITVNGVTIDNPLSPNTDGVNAESCKYVHVSNCHISVGDDCITIKSGKDLPGRLKNAPAENYTITNCTMLNGHGGVVIGSEMSGGVKKIVISNCVFDGTDRGIRIKTTRGRGNVVEDIRVDNIVMKNIKLQAIVLDMQYSKVPPEPVSERTPVFRNIRLSNITAYTKQAMYINGLDEMPVQEISLNDIVFEAETGITIKNARDIELHNVRVNTKSGSAVQAEKTQRLDIDGVTAAKPIADAPLIKLNNVQEVLIRNCWPFAGTRQFALINGTDTKNVKLMNNELGDAMVVWGDEVKR
ncbi:glycoside hydrolase family 28 protein [Ferruginibacter sp.]